METFAKLFASLLALVYHCFDRVVILGHLPLLTRSENIVHFFRDIRQSKTISKEVLRQRTKDYHRWVEVFAKRRKLPVEWAEKGCARKTTFALPAAHAAAPSVRCLLHPQKHGFGPCFAPPFPGFRPRIPITASSLDKVPVTPTIYFYLRDQWRRLPIASLSLRPRPWTSAWISPLVQRLALPIPSESSKIPGI